MSLCVCFYLKREGTGDVRIYRESLGGECVWCMRKEGKLGLQSTNKAKHENRKESWRLASREVVSALRALRLWDPKFSFVFSTLLTQSTTWQGSQHLRSPFFFLPLGSGCPASWRLSWCDFCVRREVSFSGLCLLLPENISCAYCQFVSISQITVSQDLGLLVGLVTSYMGRIFWAGWCEVEGQRFVFWSACGNLPGLSEVSGEQWLRVMQTHSFLEETFGSQMFVVCFRNALEGTVCPLAL